MTNFRQQGPQGLDAYLRTYGRGASRGLDLVCGQQDAHTSLLYWFTDLELAIAEARRTHRPILSLRLLGRLDEELSCANSRFFRKLLYPDARINQVLRQDFVLHWESVRPVPVVTLDFGDGRRIERTLTGNSAHLVLDVHGRLVDALPGLVSKDAFLELLAQARTFARAERRALPRLHAQAASIGVAPRAFERQGTPPPIAPSPSRAMSASMIAPTKHMVEMPLLRAVSPVDADTAQNAELHRRIHEAFAAGAEWAGIAGFVEWMYAELFEMPLGDPSLGLDVPDPFGAPTARREFPLPSAR